MNKLFKRIIAVILTVAMCAGLYTTGFAVSNNGDDINTYVLANTTGTLNLIRYYNQDAARETLNYMNEYRSELSDGACDDLIYDYDLEVAAMQRAAEISIYNNSEHTRPSGKGGYTALDDIGYEYDEWCEVSLPINKSGGTEIWGYPDFDCVEFIEKHLSYCEAALSDVDYTNVAIGCACVPFDVCSASGSEICLTFLFAKSDNVSEETIYNTDRCSLVSVDVNTRYCTFSLDPLTLSGGEPYTDEDYKSVSPDYYDDDGTPMYYVADSNIILPTCDCNGKGFVYPSWQISSSGAGYESIEYANYDEDGNRTNDREVLYFWNDVQYGEIVYVTATVFGEKLNVGFVYTNEDAPVIEHIVAKDATCTEPGNIEYYYDSVHDKYYEDSRLSYEISYEDTIIPALGHNWVQVSVITEPTCTEDGLVEERCSNCGLTEEHIIRASGHVIVYYNQKNPDCIHDGYIAGFYCSNCGQPFDESMNEIPYLDVIIPATNIHTWDNGTITKEPSCTETGIMTYTCTVCETTKEDVIPMTEHTYDTPVFEWSADEPKCEAIYVCTVCGEEMRRDCEIELVSYTEPSCTEPGEAVYSASIDNYIVTEEDGGYGIYVIPAIGHSFPDDGTIEFYYDDEDPYNASAIFVFVCENCGEVFYVEGNIDIYVEGDNYVYVITAEFNEETYEGITYIPISEFERVDKSALENLIADVEGLNKDEYTEESWNVLQDTITNAKKILTDENATQEDVDNAIADIESAIAGLVKNTEDNKATEPNNNEADESDNTSTNNTDNNTNDAINTDTDDSNVYTITAKPVEETESTDTEELAYNNINGDIGSPIDTDNADDIGNAINTLVYDNGGKDAGNDADGGDIQTADIALYVLAVSVFACGITVIATVARKKHNA